MSLSYMQVLCVGFEYVIIILYYIMYVKLVEDVQLCA